MAPVYLSLPSRLGDGSLTRESAEQHGQARPDLPRQPNPTRPDNSNSNLLRKSSPSTSQSPSPRPATSGNPITPPIPAVIGPCGWPSGFWFHARHNCFLRNHLSLGSLLLAFLGAPPLLISPLHPSKVSRPHPAPHETRPLPPSCVRHCEAARDPSRCPVSPCS